MALAEHPLTSAPLASPQERQTKTIHAVGHGHLDPTWLWPMSEGFHEAKSTFTSVLDRMREFPHFTFLASSPLLYDVMKRIHPRVFDEIKKRVAEGRWDIAGGMWVEPDCNIPSGESFARQLLYGQRFFQENFGKKAEVGFNPDAFGHAGSLPQILQDADLEGYVFMRPHPNEANHSIPYERPFIWQGTDGTQIPAYRVEQYAHWPRRLEGEVKQLVERMPEQQTDALFLPGAGNHGGGPTIEGIEELQRIHATNDHIHIRFGRLRDAFNSFKPFLQKDPVVVHGEMQVHAPGCYSADALIKQKNREAENRFLAAEKLNVLAGMLTGHSYPKAELQQVGKTIATNQFHDILAGTSYPDAARTARQQFDGAISTSEKLMWEGLLSIAGNIKIEQQSSVTPIIAFNPHTWQSKVPVAVEVPHLKPEDMIVDNNGQKIPHQIIKSHTGCNDRTRVVFMADLPSMGYKVYKIVNKGMGREQNEFTPREENKVENQQFSIEFDPKTGYISRLFDKQREVDIFKGSAAVPVVIDDPTDTWGHGMYRFDHGIGKFTALEPPQLVESGPVLSTIRIKSAYGNSTLTQDFTLYNDSPRIDIKTTVDWHEKHKMLKLQFPVNLHYDYRQTTFETPYGKTVRGEYGNEVPMQSWMDVSGVDFPTRQRYGISFLNDGKYSCDIASGPNLDIATEMVNMTVLRSPVSAHHIPNELHNGVDYEYLDQGQHTFTYSLLPHDKGWEESNTPKHAAELNQQPLALVGSYNKAGKLPHAYAGFAIDKENVMATVVKQTEDSDSTDTIVRLFETTGSTTSFHLRLGDREITEEIGPGKILTLRIPQDAKIPYQVTNILEMK